MTYDSSTRQNSREHVPYTRSRFKKHMQINNNILI